MGFDRALDRYCALGEIVNAMELSIIYHFFSDFLKPRNELERYQNNEIVRWSG